MTSPEPDPEPAARRRIAVVGLGYAGLPVAVACARRFPGTLGHDRDARRVAELEQGHDATRTFGADELAASGLRLTADPADLAGADFYVVAVPTPIDAARRPDLEPLRSASRAVGRVLSPGDVVVYESTVFPGATEEICGAILAETSGLAAGVDFKLGYSPERSNPGDAEHTLERTVRVLAAQDEETLELLASVYGAIVPAGIHRAPSIQVAEAAKVIENVQRDLNIALMNELAVVFDRLGLDTRAVLDAAATKWNFHRYQPGLVGGHCIGVDPYYLTTRAESVGIHTEVILAGRRVNDEMGRFVARRALQLVAASGRGVGRSRIGVLGLTFKADVPDIRNSRVPDVVRELEVYGAVVLAHDPLVEADAVRREYGLDVVEAGALRELDALILATPHEPLLALAHELAREVPILVDVTGALDPRELPPALVYWRL